MFSCNRNAQINVTGKPQLKQVRFQYGYLIHTLSERAFKGTMLNRALPILHERIRKYVFKNDKACKLNVLHLSLYFFESNL